MGLVDTRGQTNRPSDRTRRIPEERAINPVTVSPTGLDHQLLDEDAVRALQRLSAKGFEAYLVGGCVRDLLIGLKPKDFDIATSALPREMRRVFPRNCRVIGRRFKLAHLHFNGNTKILEAATFRRTPEGIEDDSEDDDLLIVRDNVFGSAEEDALRRDFTVNALFFDPLDDRIIDYAGGLADIRARVIRTIGDPGVRFREDPVRILRAAKFAGRLGFTIDPPTYAAMKAVAPDLTRAAPPRLLEEVLRLLRGGHALDSFQILRDVHALQVILPAVGKYLAAAAAEERLLFWRTLESLDNRIARGEMPANPVLLGALFMRPLLALAQEPGRSPTTIAEEVIGPFAADLRLPRRDAGCLKRICGVQTRFTSSGRRRFRMTSFLRDAHFPQALELFELTCRASGEGFERLANWRRLAAEAGSKLAADADPDTDFDADPDMDADDMDVDMDADRDVEDDAAALDAPTLGEEDVVADLGAETGTDAAIEAAGDAGGSAPGRGRSGRRRRRRRKQASRADAAAPATPVAGANEAAEATGGRRGRRRRRRKRTGGPGREAGHEGRTARTATGKEGPRREEPRREGPGRGQAAGKKQRQRGRVRKRDQVNIKTVEPELVDVSAFDLELDPKRVPTFTSIVEGEDQGKKRRRPRVPGDEVDTYKPPPPPGGDRGDQPPPPPPDDDVFGDW